MVGERRNSSTGPRSRASSRQRRACSNWPPTFAGSIPSQGPRQESCEQAGEEDPLHLLDEQMQRLPGQPPEASSESCVAATVQVRLDPPSKRAGAAIGWQVSPGVVEEGGFFVVNVSLANLQLGAPLGAVRLALEYEPSEPRHADALRLAAGYFIPGAIGAGMRGLVCSAAAHDWDQLIGRLRLAFG